MLHKFGEHPKAIYEDILAKGSYDASLPFSCMFCGYCAQVCPKDLKCNAVFQQMREEIHAEEGGVPAYAHANGAIMHQRLHLNHRRMKAIVRPGKAIFFPGCGLHFDDPALVMRVFSYLQEQMDVGISNACCAKPTRMLGDVQRATAHVKALENEWVAAGVCQVIVGCQNCYATFASALQQVEVVSIYEVLDAFDIPEDKRGAYAGHHVTIHDPCPTRSVARIHTAVRSLVKRLGFEVHEMPYTKEETLCCGKGGMIDHTAPDTSREHTTRRQEHIQMDCITYCRECTQTLAQDAHTTVHLLDLLFSDIGLTEQKKVANPVVGYARRLFSKELMK